MRVDVVARPGPRRRAWGGAGRRDQDPDIRPRDVVVGQRRRKDRRRFGEKVLVDGLCATEAKYSSSATGEEPGLVAQKLMAAAKEGLGSDPRTPLTRLAPSQIASVFRRVGDMYIVTTYWQNRGRAK